MKKVLFDCDNTMGLVQKDVDDGLTLMYLHGRSDVLLLGVTLTFGNSTLTDVVAQTKQLFNDLSITDIPLVPGAPHQDDKISTAAHFLLQTAKENMGEVTLLATGSLTNICGAYLLDPNFFTYLKEVVVMGGVLEPLILNGKQMDELNFSVDAEAAHTVLHHAHNLTIISAQLCLQALFSKQDYDRLRASTDCRAYRYIENKTKPWFTYIGAEFNTPGFYNWDIVAGVFVTDPHLFDVSKVTVDSTYDDLLSGKLIVTDQPSQTTVNIPTKILNKRLFTDCIFDAWKNVSVLSEPFTYR